ncbi:MAG: tetratricopeptide repeat protein [Acidobacteria bacterium]|nr:tetratricopeptide repeat protein [Acidobacteriota bacterium]
MQVQTAIALLVFAGAMLHAQPDVLALRVLYQREVEAREKQYGPEHPAVARALSDIALFLRNQALKDEAEPLLRRALAIDEKASGAESERTVQDLEDLVSVMQPQAALPFVQRLARSSQAGVAARNLSKLASWQESAGNNQAALKLYREALAKEESALRLNDVALLMEPPAAEPLLRRALAIQEKATPGADPDKASTLNNLANVLLATGRISQAEPLLRRGLSMLEETLGPRHPRVATASSNLADVLRARKDYAGAQKLYERALAIDEEAYGPRHAEVAVDLDNLAELLEEMGRAAQARPLRQRAAGIRSGR